MRDINLGGINPFKIDYRNNNVTITWKIRSDPYCNNILQYVPYDPKDDFISYCKMYGKEINLDEILNKLNIAREELIKIIPPFLRKEASDNLYCAGGAIFCLVNNIRVHDYDFYCKDEKYLDRLKKYYKLCFSKSIDDVNGKGYIGKNICCITENAVTIGDKQIIFKQFGDPDNVTKEFDIIQCTYYYDYKDNCFKSYHNNYSYLFTKGIALNISILLKNKNYIGTLKRCLKYSERGLTLDNKLFDFLLTKIQEEAIKDKKIKKVSNHEYSDDEIIEYYGKI